MPKIECARVRERILALVSGEDLEPHVLEGVDRHLDKCGECRCFRDEVACVLAAYRLIPQRRVSPALHRRLAALPQTVSSRPSRTLSVFLRRAASVAAAAAAGLVFTVVLYRWVGLVGGGVDDESFFQELPATSVTVVSVGGREGEFSSASRVGGEGMGIDTTTIAVIAPRFLEKTPSSVDGLEVSPGTARAPMDNEEYLVGVRPEVRRSRVRAYHGVEAVPLVRRAHRWLADVQEADGRWMSGGRDVTPFVLLSLVVGGNTHLSGEFRQEVFRGVRVLLLRQDASGNFTSPGGDRGVEENAVAVMVLVEDYVLSGDESLRSHIAAAVDYLCRNQLDEGAWPRESGDRSPDAISTAWCIMALKESQAAGFAVFPGVFDRAVRWLRSVKDVGSLPMRDVAAVLFSRRVLGWPATHPELAAFRTRLLGRMPDASIGAEYLFFGTMAMFQMQPHGWNKWNYHLKRSLFATQGRSGSLGGSWMLGGDSYRDGRTYGTALAALALQVYYKYPVF